MLAAVADHDDKVDQLQLQISTLEQQTTTPGKDQAESPPPTMEPTKPLPLKDPPAVADCSHAPDTQDAHKETCGEDQRIPLLDTNSPKDKLPKVASLSAQVLQLQKINLDLQACLTDAKFIPTSESLPQILEHNINNRLVQLTAQVS